MPNIEWKKPSDWDSSQDNPGLEHGNDPYTSSSPETLKQGYEKQWPPLTHGLVGWWPLHTDKPVDLSGNGNHGTLNGGVTTGVAGRAGLKAMSFDGSDDSIETSLSLSHEKKTISFWFRKESGQADILSQWTPDAQGPIVGINPRGNKYPGTDGSVGIVVRDGSGTGNVLKFETKESSYSDGNWHHAVITYTPSNTNLSEYVEIFVDGEKKDTNMPMSQGEVSAWDNETLHFLYNENDNFYTSGTVCDVRIYNRILSQSEIQTLYEWGSADLARPPTDGVARYALDGDATDSFGSNDGTTNGGLTFSSDAIRGQSADFDGTDDSIATGLSLSESAFTVSGWVKTPGTPAQYAAAWASTQGSKPTGSWQLSWDGSGELVWASESGIILNLGSQPNNAYYFVTMVFDPDQTTCRAYVNGTQVASGTNSNPLVIDSFTIGQNRADNEHFNGKIDDVRIYDRALTPQEIQELYQRGTRGINMNKHTVMQ